MKAFTFLAVLSVFLAIPVDVSACDDGCARVGLRARLAGLRGSRNVAISKSVTINRVERPRLLSERRARVLVLQEAPATVQAQQAPKTGGGAAAAAGPGGAAASAN